MAATPARLVVQRDGRTLTLLVSPRYDAAAGVRRARIGVQFASLTVFAPQNVAQAAGTGVSTMWDVTSTTLSTFGKLFVSSQARKQINGTVGAYTVTSQAFGLSLAEALGILALISLSLGDHQPVPVPAPRRRPHLLGARGEAARRPAVPVSVMEQASVVGLVLVGFVVFIGLNNDIHTLTHGGFHIHQ